MELRGLFHSFAGIQVTPLITSLLKDTSPGILVLLLQDGCHWCQHLVREHFLSNPSLRASRVRGILVADVSLKSFLCISPLSHSPSHMSMHGWVYEKYVVLCGMTEDGPDRRAFLIHFSRKISG
jgi:hypothetical protein